MHLASLAYRAASAALFATTVVLSGGCGHAASQQECEEIVDKIVELELRGQYVNDPATLEQRKKTAREAKAKELLPKCMGRKITSEAMVCIRGAKSYDEIDNNCLR